MTTLAGLIERLEKAKAGSKELDADIFLALSPDAFGADILRRERDTGNLLWTTGGASFNYPQGGGVSFPIPAVTASLDAAVRLVEEKLPGRVWHVHRYDDFSDNVSDAEIMGDFRKEGSRRVHASAPTPALALVCALLKAISAEKAG